jgi:hypothetical protein
MKANDADRALIESDDTELIDAALNESNFTLSLPFQKSRVTADVRDTPSEAETARLASLLLDDGREVSADIAERERISHPTPTVFLPGNKQRSTRSILTIVLSILTVLALVGVGVLFAVKSQAATPEQQAFEAYAARQVTVETADRKLTSTFKAIGTAKADAEAFNVAAAAALAAVVGVSDETARAAADAQRTASSATITVISVIDPAETPYVAPEVGADASLTVIASGLDEISAEATRIEEAQLVLDAALTAITGARAAFTTAFTDFADTIPATATALAAANPDAGQEWRDAVTTAVTALTAAAKKGSGAAELQAYAAAAFALQDENTRVLLEAQAVEPNDEGSPPQTPARPRGDTTPDGDSPVTPSEPVPNKPAPNRPDPTQEPEEPEPDMGEPPFLDIPGA